MVTIHPGTLQPVSVADAVFQQVRDMILGGRLQPGEKINENALAQRFSVSRAPVREALRRLASEGIVEVIPRRGAFVITFTEQTVEELMDVRAALEGLAARLATERATPADIAALKNGLAKIGQAIKEQPLKGYPRDHFDFHAHLLMIANSRVLTESLSGINARIHLIRALSGATERRAPEALEEHIYIFRALESRDGELAERRMRRHVENAKKNFVALLRPQTGRGERDR